MGYVVFTEPCSTTLNCCSEFMVLAPRDLYRTYVRVQIYAVAPVRTRALQFVVRFDESSHTEPPPPLGSLAEAQLDAEGPRQETRSRETAHSPATGLDKTAVQQT